MLPNHAFFSALVVALFSPWEPSSEISRFNTALAGVWAVSQP